MISSECAALGPPIRVFSIFFSEAGDGGLKRSLSCPLMKSKAWKPLCIS
jgi:hypothetical protein